MSIRNLTNIPKNIILGKVVLVIPTVPAACLGYSSDLHYGTFQIHVQLGDWVARGEELLTVSYPHFKTEQKEFFEKEQSAQFGLRAPASGMVLGFGGSSHNCSRPDGISFGQVWPELLLPIDEPPSDHVRLQFYDANGAFFRDNWRRMKLPDNRGGHHGRVHQFPEYADLLPKFAQYSGRLLHEFPTRPMNSQDLLTVQGLRAHNLALRDQLVHLTK